MEKLTRAGWVKQSAVLPNRVIFDWKGKKAIRKAVKLNSLLYEVGGLLSPEEQLCLNYIVSLSEDRGMI